MFSVLGQNHSGMCANTTTGVLAESGARSFRTESNWSAPSEPRPPAFRFSTFTSPTKWTPFLSKQVDFAPAVNDFANEGFPLLGGRLDVLSGRTTAALVYGRRKHIINVFALPYAPRVGARDSGERSGYHTLSWQTGGRTYIAVSDVAADLAQLRDLFLKN
jgi:hypothetical protein